MAAASSEPNDAVDAMPSAFAATASTAEAIKTESVTSRATGSTLPGCAAASPSRASASHGLRHPAKTSASAAA